MPSETRDVARDDRSATARPFPDETPVSRARFSGWPRKLFIVAATGIGLCEALTMSPWMNWPGASEWLQMPIALIGFAAFILLAGPFGNAAAAAILVVVARVRWRWALWRCLVVAAPFMYVTYQLSPKPG